MKRKQTTLKRVILNSNANPTLIIEDVEVTETERSYYLPERKYGRSVLSKDDLFKNLSVIVEDVSSGTYFDVFYLNPRDKQALYVSIQMIIDRYERKLETVQANLKKTRNALDITQRELNDRILVEGVVFK